MSDIMNPNPPQVYAAIAEVMGLLAKEGISKKRKNTQQGYQFRGIDDVYNALSPFLSATKLVILPRVLNRIVTERETKSGGVLFYVVLDVEFDIVSGVDGSKHVVRVVGEAMDSGDKATNKAMSAAYKYACMEAFCIPTEGDNDADGTTHEVKPGGVTVVDPRGEQKNRSDFDPQERNKYVSRFMDAFNLDAEEEDKAKAVYSIHKEIAHRTDLYIAVGDELGSKLKAALHTYVAMAKKTQKAAA